jgi:hypothetical protein
MKELRNAEADLSAARAAYEVRPQSEGRYVRVLECENRYLRAELRTLRTTLAGLRKLIASFRSRRTG